MLEELLKKCFDEEKIAEKSTENIKTAVLLKIEEEKPMKHFTIKPLIIAAAITATGALSLVTANAATDGAVVDGIVKTINFIVNGKEVEGTMTEYTTDDGVNVNQIEFALPEDAAPDGFGIVIEGDDFENFSQLDEDEFRSIFESEDGRSYDFSEYADSGFVASDNNA